MEAKKILQSDILDIVFENRNKDYGAYALRRQYGSRMGLALCITLGIGLIAALSSFLHEDQDPKLPLHGQVIELSDLPIPEKPKEIAEPPRARGSRPLKAEQYVTLKVEPDHHVDDRDKPPTVDELGGAVIGEKDAVGESAEGPQGRGPGVDGNGLSDSLIDVKNDAPLDRVDIDASFPGGNQAWSRYISREINRNIDDLQEEGKSGSVMVQFVVDAVGNVSDVRILGCSESGIPNCLGNNSLLAEIAVDAIRKGPKWTPAIQNGKEVKAYRRQPITFLLVNL